jgi:hypothetical protein
MIQHDITNITSDVDTSAFSIEMNSSMFTMLTKNVYNDVMLAPIREWSCNAIDACIEAGNTPTYDVHVPTISEPTFSVRDYGTGLAEDDITGLFSVLGASTKRHSNKYNGTFGIGRMSGLAYATSFTVTSYFNSTEYTYLISIKDGIPANIKLSEHPTSEPNGLKISLTIQPSDISKFTKRMEFFYRFSDIKPNLSTPLDIDMTDRITISGDNWYIFDNPDKYANDAYILMANVPYVVSSYQCNVPANCVISVPTGSVSITPGRESLNYDDKTKTTIKNATDSLRKDVITKVNLDLATAPTPWEQAFMVNSYLKSFRDILDPAKLTLDSNFYMNYSSALLSRPSNRDFFLADFNGSNTRLTNHFNLYKDTHFVIQDVPSNFVNALNDIGTSVYKMIVIKPNSNTLSSIESMLPDAKSWLDHLGIPDDIIYKASDYITKAEKSAPSAKLANTTFQPTTFLRNSTDIIKAKADNICLSTNTNKYLYFEMKGSNLVDSEALVAATIMLQRFAPDSPPIIGVPQKAIAKVKLDANFTQAESYFQALAPTLPAIKQVSPITKQFERDFPTRYYDIYPDNIKALVDISKPYRIGRLISQSEVNAIKSHYAIKVNTLTDTGQFDIKSKYPLLEYLERAYFNTTSEKRKILDHYFKLETHHADNPPS